MAEKKKGAPGVSVEGIVSSRDKQPYINLFSGGDKIGQMSMAQARNFAHDILTMCARTEADAMIYKFFDQSQYPPAAAGALMVEFRNFRVQLDEEPVEKFYATPSGDPPPN